ncbi:MAG: DUF2158 domain-containing protein [Alphaproteobacteria bacterium]|nr:DUF2158 domain-containing protein [Alphaproteobacteria bacterium]
MRPVRDPKLGDLVRLKSGGPVMVVEHVVGDGVVVCDWFSDGRKLNAYFRAKTLAGVERDETTSEERIQ